MSAGFGTDGGGVVVQSSVRFVVPTSRRPRAAGFEDFRDAEAAADLDEFAARDDDFFLRPAREMPQHEHERRRAVVDHRGLPPRRTRRARCCVRGRSARPPRSPVCEIIFEVVVVCADCRRGPRSRAAAGSGARPRFVCSTTPVPLMTGLDTSGTIHCGRAPNVHAGDHGVERGDGGCFFRAQGGEFAPDHGGRREARNVQRAERVEQFFHGGNRAERGRGHAREARERSLQGRDASPRGP